MANIAQLLQSAVHLHQSGQLDQARRIYEQVLQLEPRNASALNLLGLAAGQSGQFAQAANYLKRAIEIDRSQAAFFANLGDALRGMGQIGEAIDCYVEAIRLQPTVAALYLNLGILLAQAGAVDRAAASYEHALRLQPGNVEARFALGTALHRQGNLRQARACFEEVARASPGDARPWNQLATICQQESNLEGALECYTQAVRVQPAVAASHYNLGNALQQQGKLPEAVDCYQRAVGLHPNYAEALCNLGNALRLQGRCDEALQKLEQAIQLRPDFAIAYSNLGVTLQDLARLSEAQHCLQRAVALEPGRVEFHYNLATVFRDQGHVAAALECYESALRMQPNYAQALCGRGVALLSIGHFTPGWAAYEFRVGCPNFDTRSFTQPRWDGTELNGRTLLVHCEQGLGDTLQFIRYAKLVRQRGERVVIAAHDGLVPLLVQSGYQGVVPNSDPLPTFDVHVPLLSLPHVFRTEVETVPHDVPYLAAAPQAVQAWREKLSSDARLKVGIVWQGRTSYRSDRARSIPLLEFEPLARVPGVQLFSLQKGAGSEQIAAAAGRFPLVDLGSTLDETGGAFLETAAVIKNLDLVVACDTAIAHLAGALGVRVWLALAHAPDWRWMLKREDSPWYPTARLFRQSRQGHWDDVFARMAEALRTLPSAQRVG